MRVRIPKYGKWRAKQMKNFQPGPLEAMQSGRFEGKSRLHDNFERESVRWDISYGSDDIKNFVHVYDSYKLDFVSTTGQDFALIQIPIYKSSLHPNTFQVWVSINFKQKEVLMLTLLRIVDEDRMGFR